jgi:hypothetical protein
MSDFQRKRQWHIAFCAAAGYRVTCRMNDADTIAMCEMRSVDVPPEHAANVIRDRVNARWAVKR